MSDNYADDRRRRTEERVRLEERVLEAVRAGVRRLISVCATVGVGDDRVVGRALQRLQERGAVVWSRRGGWRIRESPSGR